MNRNVSLRAGGLSLLLLVLAILCFLLAALGAKLGVDTLDLGLAFFAGSFIV